MLLLLLTKPLLFSFLLASPSHGVQEISQKNTHSSYRSPCEQIAGAISGASEVFYFPAPQYSIDISHWSPASSENSTCSVEPGSAEDVSKILRILGPSRTPFAVKGGGHAWNPGFSSTTGVQIAMSRFSEMKVNSAIGTVEVGAGLTWDQVYRALDGTGVNVIGGRVPGVGVAGLTLGGGYSFKSSQYGLAIDNIVGYELVLPNGTIRNVTPKDGDLWFGLRGGMNNFGIVTKFILKSYPQSKIWGGILVYPGDQLDAFKTAFVKFQQQKDTKAALNSGISYASGQLSIVTVLFYDAPTPPEGVFDDFLTIPLAKPVKPVLTKSFSDFIQEVGTLGLPSNFRYLASGAPVTLYSLAVLDAFVNETTFWGAHLAALDETVIVTSVLEPFDSGLFSHGSPSAYPPDRSRAIFPSLISLWWSKASLNETMSRALRQSSDAVRAAALDDGQDLSRAAVYVNYALFDTPLEDMYGGNLERLREIKASIDPENVMGLAGGFKF
ncbi:FAD-binding domain-containing protein [Russula brevipes]|nr:FAD-binding domain-containing protein [Russula brevipes]